MFEYACVCVCACKDDVRISAFTRCHEVVINQAKTKARPRERNESLAFLAHSLAAIGFRARELFAFSFSLFQFFLSFLSLSLLSFPLSLSLSLSLCLSLFLSWEGTADGFVELKKLLMDLGQKISRASEHLLLFRPDDADGRTDGYPLSFTQKLGRTSGKVTGKREKERGKKESREREGKNRKEREKKERIETKRKRKRRALLLGIR